MGKGRDICVGISWPAMVSAPRTVHEPSKASAGTLSDKQVVCTVFSAFIVLFFPCSAPERTL